MGILLAIVRLVIFLNIAIFSAIFIFLCRIFALPQSVVFFIFRAAKRMIRFFLGIRVSYHGERPAVRGVIMANHRSYIDIVLIPSKVPYVIVAKKQVRSWPVVGLVGIALKVIFVDRDSPESRRNTRHAIRDRLKEKLSVLIFPEGTTYEGPGILEFKPGMFNTCAEDGFTVIPVAIEYEKKEMAWIGKDTFVPHFIRTFRNPMVRVAVSFGLPLSGNDAAVLRELTKNWVAAETFRLRGIWNGE